MRLNEDYTNIASIPCRYCGAPIVKLVAKEGPPILYELTSSGMFYHPSRCEPASLEPVENTCRRCGKPIIYMATRESGRLWFHIFERPAEAGGKPIYRHGRQACDAYLAEKGPAIVRPFPALNKLDALIARTTTASGAWA